MCRLCSLSDANYGTDRALGGPGLFCAHMCTMCFMLITVQKTRLCHMWRSIRFLFPNFPVPHFPPPVTWCRYFQSCIFHPCSLVPIIPVPHFPVSHFQRPRLGHMLAVQMDAGSFCVTYCQFSIYCSVSLLYFFLRCIHVYLQVDFCLIDNTVDIYL